MPRPDGEDDLLVREGDVADLVLLPERSSIRGAALDPCFSRVTIRSGYVVARRGAKVELAHGWHALQPWLIVLGHFLLVTGVLLGVYITFAMWLLFTVVIIVVVHSLPIQAESTNV